MLATLLLLTAVMNESFRVPAHEYRFIPVRISHWPAALSGRFRVTEGGPVRVELVAGNQLDNFVRGRAYEVVVALGARKNGEFQQAIPEEGDYDFVLINNSDQADEVRLQSNVQFASEPDMARYLAPKRRGFVILVSLLLFTAIVSWSGWRLVRAMRRDRTSTIG